MISEIVTLASVLFVSAETYMIEGLPTIWFGILLFTLGMYLFLEGFDFGLGMLYGTRKDPEERETLLAAFGPVWEANEVWLVAFGTILLAAFPPVYAVLLSDHYLLVFALVFALLLRGISPEMREQRDDPVWRRRWNRGFVIGSALSPFFLGVLAGGWLFGTGTLSIEAMLTGLVVVCLSLVCGASFIAYKTADGLRSEAIRYGSYATGAYLGVVVALLAIVSVTNPLGVRGDIISIPVAVIVVLTVAILSIGLIAARRGRYRMWFLTAAGAVLLLVAFIVHLLYPIIYPATGLTVQEAVVSPLSLNMLTVVVIPVLFIVLAYFKYLYRVFAGPIEVGESYGYTEYSSD